MHTPAPEGMAGQSEQTCQQSGNTNAWLLLSCCRKKTFHHVAQADSKLIILPQCPKWWDPKCGLQCPAAQLLIYKMTAIHDHVELTFRKWKDWQEKKTFEVEESNAIDLSYWKNNYQLRIYNQLTSSYPTPLAFRVLSCTCTSTGQGLGILPW